MFYWCANLRSTLKVCARVFLRPELSARFLTGVGAAMNNALKSHRLDDRPIGGVPAAGPVSITATMDSQAGWTTLPLPTALDLVHDSETFYRSWLKMIGRSQSEQPSPGK